MRTDILVIKGAIASLPKEDQDRVTACYEEVKAALEKHGDIVLIAFALLGAELSEAEG